MNFQTTNRDHLQTYPKSPIKSQTHYTLIIIGGEATSLENSFDSRTNSRHFVGTLIMDNKTFILRIKNQQNKQDGKN